MLLHFLLVRLQHLFVLVHRFRRIFHQVRLVPSVRRIDRAAFDAEVQRKAANKHALDLRLAQQVGYFAHGYGWLAEWRSKGRVRFDATVFAFLDEMLDAGGVELGDYLAAGRSLHTVVGPEGDSLLFDVGAKSFWVANGVCRSERLRTGVLTGKRAVVFRVVVLGGELSPEW